MNLPVDVFANSESQEMEDLGVDHGENVSVEDSSKEYHVEKQEYRGEDDFTKIPSPRNRTDTRQLSLKAAKQKSTPKREFMDRKAKRQHCLKNLSSDSDSEWEEFEAEQENSESISSEIEEQDQEMSDSISTRSHKCNICRRSYMHLKSLQHHLKTHLKCYKPKFHCQTCEATFTQKNDFEKHVRIHKGSRPFKCEKCGKSFTQLSSLKRHQRVHTNEKRFSCNECGARFNQSSSLKRHENSHKLTKASAGKFSQQQPETCINSLNDNLPDQERERFTCDVCNANFFRYSNLWTHKKSHQPDMSNDHRCQECNKTFSTKSNLIRHCRYMHEKSKPESNLCAICGKQFSRSINLRLHMSLHKKPERHRCHICAKIFMHSSSLSKHLTSHHKVTCYSCEQCGQNFRHKFYLNLHRRTMGGKCSSLTVLPSYQSHIDCLKYICQYCDSKFPLRSKLAKHIRKSHPEVGAFSCDVCDRSFCYFLELVSHRKTHRYIPYQCKICKIAFPRHLQLLQHRKDHFHNLRSSGESPPLEGPSLVSEVASGTEISSKQKVESNLSKELNSCSKTETEMETEASVSKESGSMVENLVSRGSENHKNLKCETCGLVFLINLHFIKHCRLAHGVMKYSCQNCNRGFDLLKQLHLHMKTIHPESTTSRLKAAKKKKSRHIIKPKEPIRMDSTSLERLLKAKVKEAMENSKRKISLGTTGRKIPKHKANSYVVD